MATRVATFQFEVCTLVSVRLPPITLPVSFELALARSSGRTYIITRLIITTTLAASSTSFILQ